MTPALPAWARATSLLLAALAAGTSLAGVLHPALYRDNAFVRAGWLGNDLVTLLLAVPALVVATRAADRGSLRGRLTWMGVVACFLYDYAFYLFGCAFNAAFLAYVALVALSAYTLVGALVTTDLEAVAAVRGGRRFTGVAAWMGLVAVFLGGFWCAVSAGYLVTGEVPGIVATVGHPTNVIGALDLTMVVPLNALGAWWLRRGSAWGFALAVVANVKGALYMAALVAATVTAARAGVGEIAQAGLWSAIGVGCTVASARLLR